MNTESSAELELPQDLQARLNVIIQTTPRFWNNNRRYQHFTNHGPEHSERVHSQKLAQLALELPETQRLIPEEIFIVSAAAWLYEVGMQSPNLGAVLDFDCYPGEHLTFSQLQQIRANRHLLTQRMIIDSVKQDYQGPPLGLGLTRPADEYTQLIAEVCRWCCDEPLEEVPESWPVKGVPIRVPLLVALLRLADQLYIDSSRVNLDLLNSDYLSMEEFAKWWAYHYTQTLPITGGKIQFHYFLPSRQKQYLGHIRALVEPNFEYKNNIIIQYLSDQYELHLIPRTKPTFKFDQPDGFQREMSQDLIWFLRQEIKPIPTDTAIEGHVPLEEQERECLLVLDYENFIVQLGREGYSFTSNEVSRLVVDLLTAASENHPGRVEALAIGHWDRPDLIEVAGMLKSRIYKLVRIKQQDSIADIFRSDVMVHLQRSNAPQQIILVAPREELASMVNELRDGKRAITAWIGDLPEADIYRAVARDPQLLRKVLKLSKAIKIHPYELEILQAACVFRLGDEIRKFSEGKIPLPKLSGVLNEVPLLTNQMDWMQIWLINQGVLGIENVDGQPVIYLDTENEVVVQVHSKRRIVIEALQELSSDDRKVNQDRLFDKLRSFSLFRHERSISGFLDLLKEEDLVYRDARPSLSDGPLWQLNPAHRIVIEQAPDRHLRRFVLAFDQALVKQGYAFMHKRFIPEYLASHFGEEEALKMICNLALSQNLIRVRIEGKRRYRRVHVMLVEDTAKIVETFRNRNTLLSILNHRSAKEGKTKGALWRQLRDIAGFTLNRQELDQVIDLLHKDAVVDIEQDIVKLNFESLLTQRLLGRMNLYGLVRNLRLMGATSSNKKKPVEELIDKLSKFVTHHNRQEAQWTLDYARVIKLVSVEDEKIFLKRHSFVHDLDRRERSVCQAIAQLVKELARPGSGGWVPRFVVLQRMSRDVQFGYDRGGHNYWIDQAIYHLHLLDKKREKINGRRQDVIRVPRKK